MPLSRDQRDAALLAATTGAGVTAGGYAGLQALKALPESYQKKVLEKLIADRPLIVSGIMAPELAGGSGEARMALNIVRKLREKGINVRYGISGGGEYQAYAPNKPYDSKPYRDSFRQRGEPWFSPTQFLTGSHIDHKNLIGLNKLNMPNNGGKAGDYLMKRMIESSGQEGKEWLARHSAEEQQKIFRQLLTDPEKKIGIADFDKAMESLRRGDWDRFAPGRLGTLLKLDNSLKPMLQDGPEAFMLPGEVRSRIQGGRAAGVFSAERGFQDWTPASTINIPKLNSVIESVIRRLPVRDSIKNKMLEKLIQRSTGLSGKGSAELIDILKRNGVDLTMESINPMWAGAAENLMSPQIGPNAGVKNLGLLYNFKANYSNPGDSYIPATELPKVPETMEEFTKSRAAGRRVMFDEINRIRALDGLAAVPDSSKVVFMSGGSIGPNGTQKLIDMLNATEGMDNVHIFDQIGGNQEYLDMVQNNAAYRNRIAGKTPEEIAKYNESVRKTGGMIKDLEKEYAEIAKKYPGRFTLTSRLPKNILNGSITGANLYTPYGGSSSAQEATAFLTPQLFTTDDTLNKGNLEFIIDKANKRNLVNKLDNTSTSLVRHLRNNEEVAKILGKSTDIGDQVRTHLTDNYRLGLFDQYGSGATGGYTIDKAMADAARATTENKEKVRRMLSDEVQNAAFSEGNLSKVRNHVLDQTNATDRLLNKVKSIMTGEEIVARTDKGLKFGFGLHGIKNGLKGTYLRLGRALSNGSIVKSRFAPALAGAGALAGGIGSYFAGKKLTER